MSSSPILGLPYIANSQSQPEVTHNEALNMIQTILVGAISLGGNTPPGSPNNGDSYLIGPAPTGAWAGHDNAITSYINGQWYFVPGYDENGAVIPMNSVQEGLRIFVKDSDATYVWTDKDDPGNYTWQLLSLEANLPGDIVYVDNIADFPNPLADDTIYLITVPELTLTTGLVFGMNSTVRGYSRQSTKLIFNGTGTMFTMTKDSEIKEVATECPNGTLFDFNDTTGSQFVVIDEFTCTGPKNVGTFNGNNSVIRLTNYTISGATTSGFVFTGSWNVLSSQIFVFSNTTDFSAYNVSAATFNIAIFNAGLITVTAGSAYLESDGDSDITAGGRGLVINNTIRGTANALAGTIDVDSEVKWEFERNSVIKNTKPTAFVTLTGNTTPTTLTEDVWTKVAGTWVVEETAQCTGDTTGRITNNLTVTQIVPVHCTVSIDIATGNDISVDLAIAKNGTVVASSISPTILTSGNGRNMTVVGRFEISENDYVELFVRNNDTSSSVTIDNAKLEMYN